MTKEPEMDGVGRNLRQALEREATSGDAREYAVRRLEQILDELSEIPEAEKVLACHYNRTLAVIERRERMAAI
ncbi:MAG: hypothetical protein ACOC8P_00345 [Dichotomicrobium sp.]